MNTRSKPHMPRTLLIFAMIGFAFLAIPLLSLLFAVPWTLMWSLLTSENALSALRLSLITATVATLIAFTLGLPLAWWLANTENRFASVVRPVVTLPLVLPPVVAGVVLLLAFGRSGLIGQVLFEVAGIQLTFTTAAVIIAETFVAMPFLIITVEGALRSQNQRLIDAARTLGASQWTTLRRVTLPLIAPSLLAGAILCWARAIGEFGATITFAGNLPGVTQTLPLAVYASLEVNRDEAIALSALLIAVCVIVLVVLRDRFLRPSRG